MLKTLMLTLSMLTVCLSSAEARMYKCKTPDGSITFSDTPCFDKDVKIERIDRANYTNIERKARSNYELFDLCATKHPVEEDSIRQTCVRAQAAAYAQLTKLTDLYEQGSAPHQAKDVCIEASRDKEGPADYQKALRCTRKQINNP